MTVVGLSGFLRLTIGVIQAFWIRFYDHSNFDARRAPSGSVRNLTQARSAWTRPPLRVLDEVGDVADNPRH